MVLPFKSTFAFVPQMRRFTINVKQYHSERNSNNITSQVVSLSHCSRKPLSRTKHQKLPVQYLHGTEYGEHSGLFRDTHTVSRDNLDSKNMLTHLLCVCVAPTWLKNQLKHIECTVCMSQEKSLRQRLRHHNIMQVKLDDFKLSHYSVCV